MKRILTLIVALLFMGSLSFAQHARPAAPKSNKIEKKAAPAKGDKKTGTHVKNDGTPDMRYKENKEMKKDAKPMKKDGTPDMRHKANKMKKNGTGAPAGK